MAQIEILATVGSGKTTLAKSLSEQGFDAVIERPEQNPFLAEWHRDPSSFAFETTTTFFLDHISKLRHIPSDKHYIFDFSFAQDFSFARLTFSHADWTTFLPFFESVVGRCEPPAVVIHLFPSTNVILERIARRGILAENHITAEFIDEITIRLQKAWAEIPRYRDVPILYIENEDFVSNPDAIIKIGKQLRQLLTSK